MKFFRAEFETRVTTTEDEEIFEIGIWTEYYTWQTIKKTKWRLAP